MLQFSEFICQIKWIYLESRNGKGIPDGIVKCAIQNLIAYNPSLPIYTVKYFMTVELYQYSSEDVKGLNNKSLYLFAIQGTAKLQFLTKKAGEEVYLLQTANRHSVESEEEQVEEPDV